MTDDRRLMEVAFPLKHVSLDSVDKNEWAKAANLRDQNWLYVVYDCAATHPRLLCIQDPFVRLLVRAKGGVVIDEASVFEAAEEESIQGGA